MDSQYLESWISFISSRPFYPLYYIIKYHWYLYKKFLPHFTGIARYSNLVEELMLFDEGGSVRVVWPLGVIMWTQGRVETRGPDSGDRELDHLLLYFHCCAARLCGAAWWPYCVTPPTPAPSHSATSAARPWTRYWYASPGPPHTLPPEIIPRYFRYVKI